MIAAIERRSRDMDATMPKKKTSLPPEDSGAGRAARRQELSIDTLKKRMHACRAFLAEMDVTIQEAQSSSIRTLDVDGATKLERAAELLDEFAGNLSKGLRKARRTSAFQDDNDAT